MRVLGIESSCDETAAAVVEDGQLIRSNIVASQTIHRSYGGVVPELASRAHIRWILPVLDQALKEADTGLDEIDGIAVTRGPGLVGSLLIGLSVARALAVSRGLPAVGVNHLEGHLFTGFLANPDLQFPFITLIVSGGHTQLVLVEGPSVYRSLGQTRDDAAGEAFDKVARILNLPYPGGPVIDCLAANGNPAFVKFPRPYLGKDNLEFSFSGLKTAVLHYVRSQKPEELVANLSHIAASFQAAVVDVLIEKTLRATAQEEVTRVVITGGVACNSCLRARMAEVGDQKGVRFTFPPAVLCTDNAAMIAAVGDFYLSQGKSNGTQLTVSPRLNLDPKRPGYRGKQKKTRLKS